MIARRSSFSSSSSVLSRPAMSSLERNSPTASNHSEVVRFLLMRMSAGCF
jgi:hypothetical protein